MQKFSFLTEWFFINPIEEIWEELEDFRSFPTWWQDWKRFELRDKEHPIKIGSVFDCSIRGSLPYTLNYSLEITNLVPPYLNEHIAFGDLQGAGKWILEEHEGKTKVEHHWEVMTANPILNTIAQTPYIKKLMYNNHENIMERGYQGLKSRLDQKKSRLDQNLNLRILSTL